MNCKLSNPNTAPLSVNEEMIEMKLASEGGNHISEGTEQNPFFDNAALSNVG